MKEYQMLLAATQQQMAAWREGNFKEFDAVVGENACQIRAVKIAMTTLKCQEAVPLQLATAQRKMERLSQTLDSLMKSGISLEKLLQKEELNVTLSADGFFCLQTFLLSVAKSLKSARSSDPLFRNDAANPKNLQKFGDVTPSFCDSLVKKLRQLLSAASVAYVRKQAQNLRDPQLVRMCSEEFTPRYNSCWPCTPMFWTYKTLLLSAQREKIPLVLKANFLAKDQETIIPRERFLCFLPQGEASGSPYEEWIPCEQDAPKTAIVVQGVMCADMTRFPPLDAWRAAICPRPIEIILAGAADHRQYPDPNEDMRITRLGDAEFEGYRAMARREGYSLENPGMFFIQHVYPETLGKLKILNDQARFAEERFAEKVLNPFLPERPACMWPVDAVIQIMAFLEEGDA